MGNAINRLEAILGESIERKGQRAIPGLVTRDSVEVLYFAVDAKANAKKLFKSITNHTNPPIAQSGGASESGCVIVVPGGLEFHALSYHGDLEGWRKDIEIGAAAFGALLAKIDASAIVLEDGRSFLLNQCTVKFL